MSVEGDKGVNAKSNPKTAPAPIPGAGISSLQTSKAFRLLNFELYAKPNKVTMFLGLLGFGTAIGYLAYMRYNYDGSKYYIAESDDGPILREKIDRWKD